MLEKGDFIMKYSKIKLMKQLQNEYQNYKRQNQLAAKKRMWTAKLNHHRLGRKSKYKLSNPKIKSMLKLFKLRGSIINPSGSAMDSISRAYQIPVSTIYRLAHKYLGFHSNRK